MLSGANVMELAGCRLLWCSGAVSRAFMYIGLGAVGVLMDNEKNLLPGLNCHFLRIGFRDMKGDSAFA